MAAHLFSESGQMQEVDIPDIFDVLEGGEDENAVKYLLGFGGEEVVEQGEVIAGASLSSSNKQKAGGSGSSTSSSSKKQGVRKRDTSGLKAIYHCDCCTKAFTTKFNLKRHINMHCHRSKEMGVPIQGPPSANTPSKKPIQHRIPKTSTLAKTTTKPTITTSPLSKPPRPATSSALSSVLPASLTYQVGTGAATATVRVQPVNVTASQPQQQPQTIIHTVPSPDTKTTPSTRPTDPSPTPSLNLSPSLPLPIIQDLQPVSASSSPLPAKSPSSAHTRPITVITASPESVSAPQTKSAATIPLLQTLSSGGHSFSVTVTGSPALLEAAGASGAHSESVSVQLPQDLFETDGSFASAAPSSSDQHESKPFLGTLNGSLSITVSTAKPLGTVPAGWVRKPVRTGKKEVSVFYYNPSGKKFANLPELEDYFGRLGYSICEGVFDFEVTDEDRKQVEEGISSHPRELSGERLLMNKSSKRRLSSMEDDSRDELSSDGGGRGRSSTPEPGRKRKKLDPQQQMQTLYDFLRRYKTEDGSELCEPFIRAPKRRTDPAYFEVVSDPIDMLRIQQKLKTDEYADLPELRDDFQKLVNNALKYYKEDQEERQAALEMKDLLDKAMAKVEVGEDPVATLGNRNESDDDLNEMLEDLFAAVIQATDPGEPGRAIHMPFRFLPSQKRYPGYYKVIKDPIDLKTIATKIRDGEYESIQELEEDLNTMCKNAMNFNEPGSQIYRDAKFLNKLIKSKKYELEVNKVARENRGSRSTRRLQGKKHFSAEIADLSFEDSESEESSEDGVDPGDADPLWSLYQHVRRHETPSGICLAEPFKTLPSKRELPDYYAVVEEPISLNQIKKKIKSGEYSTLQDLAEDINLMFENCKLYNRPESRLYKDGVKLQKIFQAKLEELQTDDEDAEEEETGESKAARDPARKRMRVLYNTVLNHRNRDGIQIIGMFMEKPSKKDYPDYYEVITNPIDMEMVNEKIKGGYYRTEEDFLTDMKLMFSNCRQYNEETSDIVSDANVLERVLMNKAKDLGVVQPGRRGRQKKSAAKVLEKVRHLFETLRDHKDAKGRQLSLIFLRLPNPKEFPDYFEVIKNPIDFEAIKTKLGRYVTVEECLNDFVLMFDNACKFNEPDSQIYKDALTLQSLASRTVRTMQDDENTVPDVSAAVQEVLNQIFINMYNHQDAEERCFSDSLAEVPEHDEVVDGSTVKKVRALSLDLIKQRLDRGLYKRLDTFQRDVFAVLDRARSLSRTDSQIFEDAIELQMQFIRERDEACGNGDILQSKALLYSASDLMSEVTALKSKKIATELPPEEEKIKQEDEEAKAENNESSTTSTTFNQQQYNVGEFVYVETEPGKQGIFLIENIYKSNSGEQMIFANAFVLPEETFHVATRKFLEAEVFRTDQHKSIPISKVTGRCVVMPVREYFRNKPDNFDDKDVYVCESRYATKARSFKKMKVFWTLPDHIALRPRLEPLEPKRVMSVFKERIERHKEELEEIEAMVSRVDDELPANVLWSNPASDANANHVYYEQYTIPGPITLHRGDHVYVRSENGKNLIAQIDTMWTAEDNMAYFHGPWFVTPKELPTPTDLTAPGPQFYRQECFLSTISDSNPLLSVVGKCAVMELGDYVTQRPTQYSESDVYVCEAVYDESKRVIKGNLADGLKRYMHSEAVQTDEIYYFKHQIAIHKEPLISPQSLSKIAPMEIDNEDSLDAPPSVGSVDTVSTTPSQKKVTKGPAKKSVTPYILFSSETRKVITEQHKNCSFGEISRIVGDKWRQLGEAERQVYEERAKKVNEENAIKLAEEQRQQEERRRQEMTTGAMAKVHTGAGAVMPQKVAVGAAATGTPVAVNAAPTSAAALSNGVMRASPSPHHHSPTGALINRPPAMNKPLEPIFHTVPPRPQRLLHSEAYIRYIEGLTADSQTMSNWEKQLNATKENTRTDEAKLPAHWLADNGEHGTSLEALWALRDFMMCDSLGLTKIL